MNKLRIIIDPPARGTAFLCNFLFKSGLSIFKYRKILILSKYIINKKLNIRKK